MSSSSEEEFSQLAKDAEHTSGELDASDTESDEDVNSSNADEDDHSEAGDVDEKPNLGTVVIAEKISKKYEDLRGRQLFIRFPHKLPEDKEEFQQKVNALSPLIVEAHKPRQKYARFCLIDFKSREDRDTAFKSIKSAAKKNKESGNLVVSLPRTENESYVQELVQRKLRSLENKKAKAKLKHANKVAMRAKNFTSSIVVLNLPKGATTADLRKIFPDAIDVQIKHSKGTMDSKTVATVTLASTMEARTAVKEKHSLDGTELVVRFSKQKSAKESETIVNKKLAASAEGPNSVEEKNAKAATIHKKFKAKRRSGDSNLEELPAKKLKKDVAVNNNLENSKKKSKSVAKKGQPEPSKGSNIIKQKKVKNSTTQPMQKKQIKLKNKAPRVNNDRENNIPQKSIKKNKFVNKELSDPENKQNHIKQNKGKNFMQGKQIKNTLSHKADKKTKGGQFEKFSAKKLKKNVQPVKKIKTINN